MSPLRIVRECDLDDSDRTRLFGRRQSLEEYTRRVRPIMAAVRNEGDAAVRRFTAEFDGVRLEHLRISPDELAAAPERLDPALHEALTRQIAAVRAFHLPQLPSDRPVETTPGVCAWREWRPIERVGLYVPGGRGAYPSSVAMLGVPATIAGCPEIVLCTPPGPDGTVPDVILTAAGLTGLRTVFKIGGAQAIAAMTYGTESVPAVDKLFGAGNPYVTAAKLLAFPTCQLDSPAGPSELLILADGGANPRFIAADLLSDVEHGPDSPAVLVTTSAALAERVAIELDRQLTDLPRAGIARQALAACGLAVVVDTLEAAIDLANRYAPEHLEIITANPRADLAHIHHAGSVFLGPYAPNAAGDYATGTNHVLPTARYARTFSPVSVESFGRMLQVQELERQGLVEIAPTVTRLARVEDLEGHARAVEIRTEGRA